MNAKIIPSFPNYTITEEGEVRNIKRDMVRKQIVNGYGYKQLSLCNKGVQITSCIHRLIYECFVMKDGDVMPEIIDHKDNNKLNNNISNLRPSTLQENSRNRVMKHNKQSGHKNIKITKYGNFEVQINIGYKVTYSKTHKTLPLAIADRDAKLLLYHGEFANNGVVINI